MSFPLWASFYGALAVSTAVLASIAEPRVERGNLTGAALLLVGTWAASNAFALAGLLGAFAYMDAAALAWFAAASFRDRKPWAAALAALFAAELILHAARRAGLVEARPYVLALNVSFFSQLCCVAFPAIKKIIERKPRGRSPAD